MSLCLLLPSLFSVLQAIAFLLNRNIDIVIVIIVIIIALILDRGTYSHSLPGKNQAIARGE